MRGTGIHGQPLQALALAPAHPALLAGTRTSQGSLVASAAPQASAQASALHCATAVLLALTASAALQLQHALQEAIAQATV